MPAEKLLHYREYDQGLPGHPEKLLTPGVDFSSGRLGHMWAFCNGVAMANPGKPVVVLGSRRQPDGRRQRRGRPPGRRQAAQRQDADRRQQRHHRRPSAGVHGRLRPDPHAGRLRAADRNRDGRRHSARCTSACAARSPTTVRGRWSSSGRWPPASKGPKARRTPTKCSRSRRPSSIWRSAADAADGYAKAIEMLKAAKPDKSPLTYKGSSGVGKNRDDFGKIINEILDGMSDRRPPRQRARVRQRPRRARCGLHHIRKKHPEVFVQGGIMERGNFSAAAGFGYSQGQAGHLRHVQRVPGNVRQRDHDVPAELHQRARPLQPQRRGRHGRQHLPLRHQQHVRRRRREARPRRRHHPAVFPRRPAPVRRLREADLQRSGPALPLQQPRPGARHLG